MGGQVSAPLKNVHCSGNLLRYNNNNSKKDTNIKKKCEYLKAHIKNNPPMMII